MKSLCTSLLFLFISHLSFAVDTNRILLVSDIDDTIKISHVLDKSEALKNALKVWQPFLGMPELYNLIKANLQSHLEISYVSNAPESLMYRVHRAFLGLNNFPDGDLFLSKALVAKTHKYSTITKLIKESNPTLVLLVGDNGEQDAVVYSQVQNTFPDLDIRAYIHFVYSPLNTNETAKPLRLNQEAFATSGELAYLFSQMGLVSSTDLLSFVGELVQESIAKTQGDDNLLFPEWMDCRSYKSPIVTADVALITLKKLVTERCR